MDAIVDDGEVQMIDTSIVHVTRWGRRQKGVKIDVSRFNL